ncbi:MAG: hypothetical protein ACR2L2_00970 [Acidobacteriota bacterium]
MKKKVASRESRVARPVASRQSPAGGTKARIVAVTRNITVGKTTRTRVPRLAG